MLRNLQGEIGITAFSDQSCKYLLKTPGYYQNYGVVTCLTDGLCDSSVDGWLSASSDIMREILVHHVTTSPRDLAYTQVFRLDGGIAYKQEPHSKWDSNPLFPFHSGVDEGYNYLPILVSI